MREEKKREMKENKKKWIKTNKRGKKTKYSVPAPITDLHCPAP